MIVLLLEIQAFVAIIFTKNNREIQSEMSLKKEEKKTVTFVSSLKFLLGFCKGFS
jgi:hypothetical protein